ncbi:hypothetical protein [Mycobacterium sp. Aquia_213]|uniref:hypothetical protein n=1 Tax=Mycobacterium sp. Aquia_213 TaxID=2991728 RepID=UPI00226F34C8|nr:hypothetical protein [Mycobacterium sp. Aquia_213]WAC91999.1 hypothetical protein LMQ14_01910 [Mycobacterium sp. Aquia_213]
MDYPVGQTRTSRAHAGSANIPGLVAVAIAVLALSAGLYELASDARIALAAVILAAASGVAGLVWLNYAPRRVRGAEPQLVAMGSNATAPRPGR